MTATRQALVIGNSGYGGNLRLNCPTNDATEVNRSLTDLGFQVTFGTDLGFEAMQALVEKFLGRVNEPATTTSLLYYSGHGLQINDQNYMVPIDFDRLADQHVAQLVSVQSIATKMTAETAVRIILLDACRSNADAQSFVGGGKQLKIGKEITVDGELVTANGLASMQAAMNTFIAFAAGPGEVAYDGGDGDHLSPFTESFLKYVDAADLPISNLTSRVRQDVLARTNNIQKSWDQSSLMEPFYFNPGSLLMFMGNLMALVGLITTVIPYSLVLAWSELTWPWVLIGATLPIISLCILLYGAQSVYSRLRGRYVRAAGGATTAWRHLATSSQKGILGGYLGTSLGAMLLSAVYFTGWDQRYGEFNRVPLEITVATALTGALLGMLSLLWARASIGLSGLVVSENRSPTRILLGTICGGGLAGLIAAPLITMYFGRFERPLMTPDLLLPGAILGTSIFIFSVVNFDFERLSARRIWASVKASWAALGIGVLATGLIFGPLYQLGIVAVITDYLMGNSGNMIAMAKGGAIYGFPVGIILGIMIGAAVILTERWSQKPVLD
ncbi:caspase family protein [Bradyrhizobium sp. LjRoot220]|uniref:caspase family protein n=1 Tax=Bradyrhizobium sp. LjRoot220 TaxID=3342284 RepID=UPI003ECD1F5A